MCERLFQFINNFSMEFDLCMCMIHRNLTKGERNIVSLSIVHTSLRYRLFSLSDLWIWWEKILTRALHKASHNTHAYIYNSSEWFDIRFPVLLAVDRSLFHHFGHTFVLTLNWKAFFRLCISRLFIYFT